ncbi:MAG: beta-ketoacyl-ACP synthase II [Gammaproteobacteria bacterium]|nr:beta-ketoacyl-ACP synthase II [Gammaproteobacteria bacterium]
MQLRRVVVTGMGIVCPSGNNITDSWTAVINGESGVSLIDTMDTTNYPVKIAGTVKNFDCSSCVTAKEQRRIAEFIKYAADASRQAIEDSGLEIDDELSLRVGTAIGAGIGGINWIGSNHEALVTKGVRKVSPFFIPGAIINMAPGFVSMKNNLRGPNISIVTACTTGAHNIGSAMRMIQCGDADVMVAGGAEMATAPLGVAGFAAMRALSVRNDEPTKASRPFDKDRDGFVLGEGAGILILEDYEHAKKRGAKIYAEILGFGMSGDAYHMTAPDPEGRGACLAMENTLKSAGLKPEDVDYMNAHGTSTYANDKTEALAIKRVFTGHTDKLAVSSTKSMTGHLLGAAGAVEAIFSILAINNNIVPPTINLDNPLEEGQGLDFIPHEARSREVNVAMSNSFGFGGTNASLLFKNLE